MIGSSPPNAPPPPVHVFRGHKSPVNTIKFMNDGYFLLSGTTEGEMNIWNVHTKRNAANINIPEGGIVKIHQLDNITIASHSTLGSISIWDVGQERFTLTSQWNPYVVSSTESPSPLWHSNTVPVSKSAIDESDPRMIAVAAGHRDFHYIDLLDIRMRRFVQSYKDSATLGLCLNMAFIRTALVPSSMMLCGAFENGSLQWWDLRVPDKPLPNRSYRDHEEPVLCFDFDSTSCCGVSGGADSRLSVFKFDEEKVSRIQSVDLPTSGISDVKIRGDRRIFVSAGWDHRIRVYSWRKFSPLAILRFHSESVSCVDFPTRPSDGKFLLAAGSKDKRISLWDLFNE